MARPPSGETLMTRWLTALRAQGYRPNTIDAYARELRYWYAVLGDKHPLKATRDDALEYLAWCQRMEWEPSSIRHAANSVKAFYRWLAGERLPGKIVDPFLGVRLPRVQRRIRPVLTEEQVARVLAVPAHDLRGIRDAAIFATAYATGARSISLRRLNVDSIDWERGVVAVVKKGGDQHLLGFWVMASEAVQRYLRITRPLWALPGERALFVGRQGRRISSTGVRDAFARMAARAGIPRFSPHAVRRSVLRHEREAGGDIEVQRTQAGHDDPRTTASYEDAAGTQYIPMHAMYHPMATGRMEELIARVVTQDRARRQ